MFASSSAVTPRLLEVPRLRWRAPAPEALNVRIGGSNLAQLCSLNIAEAAAFFDRLELSPEESAIAGKILLEIRQRLKFLNDVGLEYLTLDRLSSTLSGGEAQRIQLATASAPPGRSLLRPR